MRPPPNYDPTEEEWRRLARQASEEKDPDKLLELAGQIVEEYNNEEKRKEPRPHDWKQLYQLAVMERDPAKLPQRISDARFAILDRIKENCVKTHDWGHQELSDAIDGLRVIQQEYERQQFGEPRQRRSAEG